MKKRFFSLVLTLVMLASMQIALPASAATAGVCGDNLAWTLDDSGTLTISGTGDMWDSPWDDVCLNIQNVIITAGVTSIGDSAFEYCYNLTSISIPNSVTSIGKGAFWDCDDLTSISIPDSVTSIGNHAFGSCTNLEAIHVDKNNSNYCDIDGVLFNKSRTILICYPCGKQGNYIIPSGVTSIGDSAFEYCYNLTSISIPDSVTGIGDYVFGGCDNLEAIHVDKNNSNYCDIDGVLFNKSRTILICYPCGKQGNYIIPSSVTGIGEFAFGRCYNLTNITIPDSVINIGEFAFHICTKLTNITISSSVTSIGDSVFGYCKNLTDVYYSGTKEQWDKISIGLYNDDLTNATIHYNSGGTGGNTNHLIPGKNDGYSTNNRFGKGVSVKVSGASGAIPNATVKIGDNTAKTNASGVAEFPNVELRKKYIVTVSADGYFSKTFLDTFYGNAREFSLLKKTNNIYVSSVFYGKGNNVHGDLMGGNNVTIENTDSDTYFIMPNVDWGNNPVGTMTLYGKKSKKSLAFTGGKLTTAIGTQFGTGEEFQLILKTNGKTYTQDLKLRTRALPKDTQIEAFNIKSGVIPSSFPFLGGNSFNINLDLTKAINTSANVKIEDDKAVVTIDYGSDNVKKEYARIFGDKAVQGTVGVKIEIPVDDLSGGKWAGYVTFKSGNKEKYKGVADYLGLATLKKTFWVTTPIGELPTYMTLDLSASLDVEAGIQYEKLRTNITGKIKPGIKGRFSGGLGIAYDSAEITVGPYGSAALNANISLNPISIKPKVALDFGMQITAKVWVINAKAEFGMGRWEWTESSKMINVSLNASDVQLLARDYDQYPHEFLPNGVSLFSLRSTNHDTKLVSNVFPSVQSRIVNAGGKEILLFTDDTVARETQNGLTLLYSTKENGTWSTPSIVADDGTLDSSMNANGSFVVWENTKQALNSNDNDLQNIMSLSEIAVAKYNGSGYDEQTILTDNTIADFAPVVASSDNTAIVAWLSNSESDILAKKGTTNICYKKYNGTNWEETQTIENVGTVSRIELQYDGTAAKIIYKNGNNINAADITTGQTKTIFTGEISQYTSSNEGIYVFANDGSITFTDYTGTRTQIAEGVSCLDIPQFLNYGNTSYILWCESRENGIGLYGIKNTSDGWSKKLSLLSGDYDVAAPKAYLSENGFTVSHIRRENTAGLTENDPIPDKFISDLYISELTPVYDLAIENAYYSGDGKIIYTIANIGTEDVDSFEITLSQNNAVATSESINERIKAGDSIKKELIVDTFDENTEAEISVAVDGVQDYNPEDNSLIFNEPIADPQVLSAKIAVGENSSYIEAEIANDGQLTDNSVKADLRKGSIDGEIIYSETYENLLSNEKVLFQYPVTDSADDYYICLTSAADGKPWNNIALCAGISVTDEIDVTVETTGNGSVTGSGNYAKGSMVTVNATADNGYTFDGWYDNNTRVSTSKQYTFKAEKDIVLTAKFTKSTNTGTGIGGGGGGGGKKGGTVVPPVTTPVVTPQTPSADWQNPFRDVSEGDWFYSAVKAAHENGWMNGTAADQFSPNLETTRGMIITVLWRLLDAPQAAGTPFADVASDAYCAQAVAWGAENGIVQGYADGLYHPEQNVTREELTTILRRFAQLGGKDMANAADLSDFPDGALVESWAQESMAWAVGAGLIQGDNAGQLSPKNNATRAETAAILMRYHAQ